MKRVFALLFPRKPSDASKISSLFSRPKTVDEVVYQDEVVSTLKQSLETGNVSSQPQVELHLPSLMFSGT